jgi:hypothetical protein
VPRNELRVSGLLQAAIIVLIVGWRFRHAAPTAPQPVWPYFLTGYAFLAATVPWLSGGIDRDEFSPRLSILLGVLFALPMAVAGHWLISSPYRALGWGCWLLAAAWAVHLLISIGLRFRK